MSGFGRIVGGHRLVAGLGSGGMARVYLALSQKQFGFTKLVVLKVLREELGADGEFLEMFMHEARLAARLNHPHVVQTYEVGVDQDIHFIAMEYLEGQALSAALSRVGLDKIPLGFQLRVICDVLDGLHYAHELCDYDGTHLGIVHRDVSPQNVFVTYTGQTKLLDFGIAKTTSSVRTSHGILKGKAGYMAPEQAMAKPPDRRADLYAIGVMIWEAIAKRRLVPRTEDDVIALTRRLAGNDPKIREVVPDAPPELADICDKAMEKNPADRWQTAEELRVALQAYMAAACPYETRDVATLLTDLFAEERTRIRRLVEQQQKASVESGPIINLQTGTAVQLPRPSLIPPASAQNEPSGHPTTVTDGSAYTARTAASRAEKRSRTPLIAAAAVVAVLVAAFVARTNFATKAPEPAASAAAPASSERTSYTLHLSSDPPGARVYEGDAMIGRTPVDLPINNGALRTAPRQLFLKQDGYESYRVDPQPATADVDTRVTLVKVATAATATASAATATIPMPPVGFAGRPHAVPGKAPGESATAPTPSGASTHRLGVEPAPTQDLRPLDTANPWEKK